MSTRFTGLPAAPGIGIGTIYVYEPQPFATPTAQPGPHASNRLTAVEEWQRFLAAQSVVDAELAQIGQSTSTLVADIFAGQRLILHDKTLLDAVRKAILDEGVDAAQATHQTIHELAELFRSLDDEYFASRAVDILDIGHRLLANLHAVFRTPTIWQQLPRGTLLVAHSLTPSDVIQISDEYVCGIGLIEGTATAHTAILARSRGIPHVCGLATELMAMASGERAIIDGNTGVLIVTPSEEEIEHYTNRRQYLMDQHDAAKSLAHAPAVTRDGFHIPVHANLSGMADVVGAVGSGADGVGLLRTEFLFMERTQPPDQDEQLALYQTIGQQLAAAGDQHPRPLTIRGLDAGADKPVPYVQHCHEENPELGIRGIRLLLAHPHLLRTQLGAVIALARAAPLSLDVRFMLPMISTVAEIRAAAELLHEISHSEDGDEPLRLKLGAMIEVPAAALMADRLAAHVDFFSIGTNDLTQYVFASDRNNRAVAELADSLHPAVLRLIETTCHAAHVADIPVGICGELASQPEVAPLLLGLGVTELSVVPTSVPLVKQVVRQCDMIQCRQLAEQALQCEDGQAVRALLAKIR